MKRALLLALVACAGLQATNISLAADPLDTGSGNTSFSFSDSGIQVTVSAWYTLSTAANPSALTAGSIQQFGAQLGLGACNAAEISRSVCDNSSLTTGNWQVSTFVENSTGGPANGNYRDFVLFVFNQDVRVDSILQLQSSCNGFNGCPATFDNDFQWWYSTTAVNSPTALANFILGGTYLGSGLPFNGVGSNYPTNAAAINTGTLRSLLIGSGQSSTDTNDKFKIDLITVSQPVPEPASMVLMGTGLLGLGLAARRRRKK